MRRAVCALIEKDGLYLSVSRKNDPDAYGLPGGKLEEGETLQAGLKREVLEETGFDIIPEEIVFEAVCPGGTGYGSEDFWTTVFRCSIVQKVQEPIEGETGEVRFIDQKTMETGPFAQYNKDTFAAIKENEGPLRIADRRAGALYGQAIGDALGAWYEFSGHLGPKETSSYRGSAHGGSFAPGEWTDDTNQALLLTQAFVEESSDLDRAVAFVGDLLQQWLYQDGRGCGNHTAQILTNLAYALDPLTVSREVWEKGGCKSAPNGGVMRAVGIPIIRPWDIHWTVRAATLGCQVTHWDPRCVASVVAMSVTCSNLIMGHAIPYSIQKGIEAGKAIEPGIEEYLNMSLAELALGTKPFIGYTYKCVGAGFWALREFQRLEETMDSDMWDSRFHPIIDQIIRERGDTDTNAAVAGALIGAYTGLRSIPEKLVKGLWDTAKLDEVLGTLPEIPA